MNDLKKYSPQFAHINDAMAFVVHLSFLQQECKLVGLSEEQYLDDLGSIPQGWNKSSEIYQFRYIEKAANKNNNNNDNKKQRMTLLVKILSMDKNELLITAVKQGSNKVYTLEICLKDHIDTHKASEDLTDYGSIYKDVDGLLVLINDQITDKVIAKKKEVKEKPKPKNEPNPLIFPDPNPPRNPLFIGGGRPGMGGDPFGGGFGRGDIDPFGGNPGNLMGPNQVFQQRRNNPNNPNGNGPPFVPPNARFDPYGPGGNFPGGPDPDHFRPPRGPGGGGGGFGGFGGIM